MFIQIVAVEDRYLVNFSSGEIEVSFYMTVSETAEIAEKFVSEMAEIAEKLPEAGF